MSRCARSTFRPVSAKRQRTYPDGRADKTAEFVQGSSRDMMVRPSPFSSYTPRLSNTFPRRSPVINPQIRLDCRMSSPAIGTISGFELPLYKSPVYLLLTPDFPQLNTHSSTALFSEMNQWHNTIVSTEVPTWIRQLLMARNLPHSLQKQRPTTPLPIFRHLRR